MWPTADGRIIPDGSLGDFFGKQLSGTGRFREPVAPVTPFARLCRAVCYPKMPSERPMPGLNVLGPIKRAAIALMLPSIPSF